MRKFVLLLVAICSFTVVNAQQDTEFGLFTGISYYNGDVNPSKLFYAPSLAYGGLIRYNFDKHYSLRLGATKSKLKANDLDFDNQYQQNRAYSFENPFTEIFFKLEFNFLPFSSGAQNNFFSPYVASGFSFMIMYQKNLSGYNYAVPFETGIKYSPNKRTTLALQWTLNKSFSDVLDGFASPNPLEYTSTNITKQTSDYNTKDWYSFAGISITYKFAAANHSCPAYGGR